MKTKIKTKKDERGKWARHPWIRILEILAKMPLEERERCIRATSYFYEDRGY